MDKNDKAFIIKAFIIMIGMLLSALVIPVMLAIGSSWHHNNARLQHPYTACQETCGTRNVQRVTAEECVCDD